MPGDCFSREQTNCHARIIPFPASLQIGDVADPDGVRGILGKPLLQVVGTFPVVCTAAGRFRFCSWHFRKVHAAHQPVHSPDADVHAIVTLEDILDFVSAQTLIITGINV